MTGRTQNNRNICSGYARPAAFCILLLMAGSGFAQEAVMTLYFRDSETGQAVMPESVTVDAKEQRAAVQSPAGKLVLLTDVGDHEVIVRTHGYKEMVTKETAVSENPPIHLLHLDPTSPPPDLRAEVANQMMTSGTGIIAGYIMDDKSGQPLPGVEIKIEDGPTEKSNARGYFAAVIEVPKSQSLPNQPDRFYTKKTIVATVAGYQREDRLNVAVLTGEIKTMKFRMKQGEGANTEDEDMSRGPLQAELRTGSAHLHGATESTDAQTTFIAIETTGTN